MTSETILVVEDEEDILELVSYNLLKEGFQVATAGDGQKALESVRGRKPDLVVLDLMLPGIDGLEVCKILRNDAEMADIPIVMLTAKGEEADIVKGLEHGADDYITKPFSPRVLIARVRAVLRRKPRNGPEEIGEDDPVIEVAGMTIHPGRHEVTIGGKVIDLTYTEFRILYVLARRPGWVFTRSQIINAVRGNDYIATDRSVDVQVVGLRRKLGKAGQLIETVRGVGYRFREQ